MAGKKGCSGRKKIPAKEINRIFDRVAVKDLPTIIDKMVEQAKAGDKQMAMYICDRILGKPHSSVDSNITGKVTVDYGAVKVQILKLMRNKQDVIDGEYKEITDGTERDTDRDSQVCD